LFRLIQESRHFRSLARARWTVDPDLGLNPRSTLRAAIGKALGCAIADMDGLTCDWGAADGPPAVHTAPYSSDPALL